MAKVAIMIETKAQQAYMEAQFNIQPGLFDGFEFPFYIAVDGDEFSGWLDRPDRAIQYGTFADFASGGALKRYHKALADVLHLIDADDFSEGSADRCQIGDAWQTLNSRGEE